MLAHVIGWAMLALNVAAGGGVARWLWVAGTRVYALPSPKAYPFTLSSGSDFVGFV